MKKRITMIIALITAAAALASCAESPAATKSNDSITVSGESTSSAAETTSQSIEYIKISAQEAKELMDSETAVVLDVRTQEEYDEGHIEGAVRMAMEEFDAKSAEVLPDKDALILVYCRSGNRSATASKILIEMGYTNVMDFGGIIDWPYDVVK